jgi:hypothetical protein
MVYKTKPRIKFVNKDIKSSADFRIQNHFHV